MTGAMMTGAAIGEMINEARMTGAVINEATINEAMITAADAN
jgi:hypothetical protein